MSTHVARSGEALCVVNVVGVVWRCLAEQAQRCSDSQEHLNSDCLASLRSGLGAPQFSIRAHHWNVASHAAPCCRSQRVNADMFDIWSCRRHAEDYAMNTNEAQLGFEAIISDTEAATGTRQTCSPYMKRATLGWPTRRFFCLDMSRVAAGCCRRRAAVLWPFN